jgi:hypothetical protein
VDRHSRPSPSARNGGNVDLPAIDALRIDDVAALMTTVAHLVELRSALRGTACRRAWICLPRDGVRFPQDLSIACFGLARSSSVPARAHRP